MKSKETISLVRWLIENTNTDSYRAGKLTGWKHPVIDQKVINTIGGLQILIKQAKELERNPCIQKTGKLQIDWNYIGANINKIEYDVSIIPELCKIEGVPDPRAHQEEKIACINYWRTHCNQEEWLLAYYDKLLGKLTAGKIVIEAEDEMLFRCLNAVTEQKEFVWERIFSERIFCDSKMMRFKSSYKDRIFTILKKYSPYYEEGMSKDELFSMFNIHSFGQNLEWKGAIKYITDDKNIVDTALNPYGTVLNAQTLEHSVPVELSNCKMIMTIENKANYESLPYDENVLYIFCHGYFTPKEVRFLKELYQLVKSDCEFYHWGDMDFGGISIFQFIKAKIFPELKPYKMDKENFKKAIEAGAGIALKSTTRELLIKKDAGMLKELKAAILETNMTIEQEWLVDR